VPSALIDLDAAPAARQRPGRHRRFSVRPALTALSLVLVALLGAAAPPMGELRPGAVVAAQPDDKVFVHGDRMWIVGAAATGGSWSMHTYRLPDGKLLARATLQIPEPVTAVLPVGDLTLVQTTVGQRPALLALDDTTSRTRWWQFGDLRGASAAAGLLLLSDGDSPDIEAVDLETGTYRWAVEPPRGGSLGIAGRADGLPQWLVSQDPSGRLDTYDGRTGRHLASAHAAPGPDTGVAGGLFLVSGSRTGITAFNLPSLTVRWHRPAIGPTPGAEWLQPDCGALLCIVGPALTAVDPATGQTRWAAGRWTYAQTAGDSLVVHDTDGPPDLAPVTVLDPATGRVRADLGEWREAAPSDDPLRYLVIIGPRTVFGRFDPSGGSVRIFGTTDLAIRGCNAGAGAMICQLLAGPVAIWPVDPR
jgi:hypothetical protein